MSAVDFSFGFLRAICGGWIVYGVFEALLHVSAAMFMIVSLVAIAALFVLLDAFYLAVLQVLVYAGEVRFFLFIIMLLDVGPKKGKKAKKYHTGKSVFFGLLSSIALVFVLFLLGGEAGYIWSPDSASPWPDPKPGYLWLKIYPFQPMCPLLDMD